MRRKIDMSGYADRILNKSALGQAMDTYLDHYKAATTVEKAASVKIENIQSIQEIFASDFSEFLRVNEVPTVNVVTSDPSALLLNFIRYWVDSRRLQYSLFAGAGYNDKLIDGLYYYIPDQAELYALLRAFAASDHNYVIINYAVDPPVRDMPGENDRNYGRIGDLLNFIGSNKRVIIVSNRLMSLGDQIAHTVYHPESLDGMDKGSLALVSLMTQTAADKARNQEAKFRRELKAIGAMDVQPDGSRNYYFYDPYANPSMVPKERLIPLLKNIAKPLSNVPLLANARDILMTAIIKARAEVDGKTVVSVPALRRELSQLVKTTTKDAGITYEYFGPEDLIDPNDFVWYDDAAVAMLRSTESFVSHRLKGTGNAPEPYQPKVLPRRKKRADDDEDTRMDESYINPDDVYEVVVEELQGLGAKQQMPNLFFLFGAPGIGKTDIGKVLAKRAYEMDPDGGWGLYTIDFSRASSTIIGGLADKVKSALDFIDTLENCIVLLDEFSQFFMKRDKTGHANVSHSQEMGMVESMIQQWMESPHKMKHLLDNHVIVIATGNVYTKENLPAAVKSRFRSRTMQEPEPGNIPVYAEIANALFKRMEGVPLYLVAGSYWKNLPGVDTSESANTAENELKRFQRELSTGKETLVGLNGKEVANPFAGMDVQSIMKRIFEERIDIPTMYKKLFGTTIEKAVSDYIPPNTRPVTREQVLEQGEAAVQAVIEQAVMRHFQTFLGLNTRKLRQSMEDWQSVASNAKARYMENPETAGRAYAGYSAKGFYNAVVNAIKATYIEVQEGKKQGVEDFAEGQEDV
jgi:hypothetical protein